MAWSAPATWSVSEVVVASKMNAHIRDNLSYLKGLAGAVTIDDVIAPVGVAALRNDGSYQYTLERTTATARKYGLAVISSGANAGALTIDDVTAGATRFLIDVNGNVGLGTAFPEGKLHGYDAISGFLHWKYDGLDGTARTIIPDGAGDVQYIVFCVGFVVRASDGTVVASNTAGAGIIPGGAVFLYNTGGNTVTLTCAANGSLTVARTGGAFTYKVGLWLLWL